MLLLTIEKIENLKEIKQIVVTKVDLEDPTDLLPKVGAENLARQVRG